MCRGGLVDTVGGEGEGGTSRNSLTDVYALPRAEELAGVNVLSNTGAPAQARRQPRGRG